MARNAWTPVWRAAHAADVVTYSLRVATAKAEETRERILDAALSLFRQRGFDETTMRDIAAEAGVATGAAYYYFRSKEELVMAFYARTAEEAREVIPPLVTRSHDLGKRIRGIIDTQLKQFEEHRRLMVALVRIGIDPKHPLSPFGEETSEMRNASIEFFRAAIAESKPVVPKDLLDDLPRLLWLYQMGIILFWMFDESRGQRRTRALLDGTIDLVVRLIQISSLPMMGRLRKRLLAILRAVEE
ncbi:MAG TPA: TetR family transcriptional regulator [Thermoanaerobaculia bacterium]|jgi:AcrR family transcriptional regulator|nr:TetR family transcriptional regulator [Thermoanaerobaculia bacterium]